MRAFVLRFAAFLALQLALATPLLLAADEELEDSYYVAMEAKEERFDSLTGPRLVIVGGSSAAFSIHSPLMQQQLCMPVVNLAVHAGLNLNFMLEQVEEGMRAGDVVVLSIEYELFSRSAGRAPVMMPVLLLHPDMAQYLAGDDWRALLDEGHVFMGELLRGTLLNALDESTDNAQPPYDRTSYNEYGDVVAHYAMPRRDPSRDAQRKIPYNEHIVEENMAELADFAALAHDAGVRVYFTYAPHPRRAFRRNVAAIRAIAGQLESVPGIVVLDKPEDNVYLLDQFFDTRYHLINAAGIDRTRNLIARLRPEIGACARPGSPAVAG